MKAILEFELPEDSEEHREALNGRTYLSVLQEIDNFLRERERYSNDRVAAKYREMFSTLLIDKDVTLWS